MPDRTVYVVVGHTGEYSDHTQWNVAAYLDREHAEEHARLANEFADAEKARMRPLHEEYRAQQAARWRADVAVPVGRADNPWDVPGQALPAEYATFEVEESELMLHIDEWRDRRGL
jgi:hypothetical protein